MNKKLKYVVGAVAILAAVATIAFARGQDGLAKVRAVIAQYQQVEAAQAAGWVQVPGLDHCFDNPGVGAMGYHYINPNLLDNQLDPLTPEALVYAPGPNGKLKLAAVEYIVPAETWDKAGNTALPSLHGRSFHLNENLGVYVLHAWIFKNNPGGMFEDWNSKVSCP